MAQRVWLSTHPSTWTETSGTVWGGVVRGEFGADNHECCEEEGVKKNGRGRAKTATGAASGLTPLFVFASSSSRTMGAFAFALQQFGDGVGGLGSGGAERF